MATARVGLDVVAGLVPGRDPMEELTRQWFISSDDWHAKDGTEQEGEHQVNLLCDLAGKGTAYATYLMLQPDRVNWVRLDWVWF